MAPKAERSYRVYGMETVSESPLWLLLLMVAVIGILIAVSSIWLANRVLVVVADDHNSKISPFITVVGLIYGALLGFIIVVAWQQSSSAETTVATEASTLTTMYRQTVAMPEPEQTQLKQLLRQYTSAVIGAEWAQQGSGEASDSARAAITGMYRIVGGQQPSVESSPIHPAFINELTQLGSNRTMRIVNARPRIPTLLWSVLISGGVVLVALTGFLRLGNTTGHVIVTSVTAILLGLLLSIAFSLDHPFRSDGGITPAPFQHSLATFDAVDRGT